MELPEDPMMLFSIINMKLRDTYPSLDALCDDLHIDAAALKAKLAAVGFEYSEEFNKFW
jgi:rRNA maturation protein Rpf1